MEMILRGCVLTSELARKAGYAHGDRYRKIYKDKYFVHDNKGYIPVSVLTSEKDKQAAKKCTNMDNVLPLSYFARYVLQTSVYSVRLRTKFIKRTGCELFGLKQIQGNDFIVIPKEAQEKFKKGYPIHVSDWKNFDDHEDVIDHFVLGDWCIAILK